MTDKNDIIENLKIPELPSLENTASERDKLYKKCFNKARRYWIQGKTDLSVAAYHEFLSVYPNDVVGLYWRGKSYLNLGKLDEALADLDKAVKLHPDYEPLMARAEIYAKKAHQDCIAADRKKAEQVQKPRIDDEDLTGSGSILLVEDDNAVRDFAARALISRGYKVLEASTATDALHLFDNYDGDVDLLISDVVLPEMDGPKLLRELRKRNCCSKIIFISGYPKESLEKNMGDSEQFAFLPKPFSLKQLAEAVKQEIQSALPTLEDFRMAS